jgi:hypothetical protein
VCHALLSSNRGGGFDQALSIIKVFVVAKCAYRTGHRHIRSRVSMLVCWVCLHLGTTLARAGLMKRFSFRWLPDVGLNFELIWLPFVRAEHGPSQVLFPGRLVC